MSGDGDIRRILRLYPDDCDPRQIEELRPDDSFSGAALWRLVTPRGPLRLRRWPSQHPGPERLEFVQAVLWHVDQEGFHRIPLPLETRHHHGFVRHAGHLWELAPWLPGTADFEDIPSLVKLRNAMHTLADFHEAARAFPLAETGPIGSPGIADRVLRLQGLLSGRLGRLTKAMADGPWPELAARGREMLPRAEALGPHILRRLEAVGGIDVSLQPCIRDIWRAHVLFEGDEVTGLIDFGSMRPENVAADVARLLGSLALDDEEMWQVGLAAYQAVRPLSQEEQALVRAFDHSTVLLGGVQWLEWIYLEGKLFDKPQAVLDRVDELLSRLVTLSQAVK